MNAQEFLELLLPDTGWIFTATKVGKGWVNTPHKNIASAVRHANTLTFTGQPAYFAMATYREERVWDATFNHGEGKWRQRTQANAQYIRSFYLDLDVDPDAADKFASKEQALYKLEEFRKLLGLPAPMIVDSGGGIHAYWPLAHAVTTEEWRPVADKLKAICLHESFLADKSLTSDQARVLRCLGGYNTRREAPVKLLSEAGPFTFAQIKGALDGYVSDTGVDLAIPRVHAPSLAGSDCFAGLGDNLGATSDPVNFDRVVFACAQIGAQVAARGAGTGEKLWRAALGIAKFTFHPERAYRAISHGHREFDPAETLQKAANWNAGPTRCGHFEMENPAGCADCPHKGAISSPIQLGREVSKVPQPVAPIELINDMGDVEEVFVAPRPHGYILTKANRIVLESEGKEGVTDAESVCPYDLYPIRILRQSGLDTLIEERSLWRAHLPRLGPTDMELPQTLISDYRKLYAYLMQKGLYMPDNEAKATQRYMSYYLQQLAEAADREKLYERLGWHDERKSFVLGNKVLLADGTMRSVNPSKNVRAVTKDGVVANGTMQGWKDAMKFYNRPGYEGHRFFVYAALGAPLFHMNDTGNKGVLLTASGDSGRGKTTCLRACASLWGTPEKMILNGNKDGSTVNALYETLGAYHSLPFFWDDITERDSEEIRRFLLNISQGKGKERMKGSELVGKAASWETIVLASANTDDVSRIMSSGRDVDPHLMRLVGVEFKAIDPSTESKIVADNFLRAINQNHGHAGPMMMKFVVQHYEKIAKGYVKNVAMVDRMLNSSNASAERYWSAAVAAAYTGAQIATSLGLIDYPYQQDLQWMVDHLGSQRRSIRENTASPLDILTEFLEQHIGNTLVVSAKNSSNLDCTVVRPYNALLIRHEMDADRIYVSRQALMEYCTEMKTAFRRLEQSLEADAVVLTRNKQKVLGADTVYAKGQTRCWEIDASKLGVQAPVLTTLPPGGNVVDLKRRA